ncbi:hypothetical protein F442_00253 [Phytophthora nicotianae P10297]|uniref:Uncharacterized protein n=2 Tax=Phytophthora nicotianae TaxID=4792 RepID=W3A7L6_PHYNI|nr:hypothetical protein L916_00236 [Phytophthora nicotianae]ETM03580.1 hypothetical protein L917_00219 [Phytophthora nicotianae]ETP55171.1 hypothetical protein F442_00253 [Phytophthora nicotianae P10297]
MRTQPRSSTPSVASQRSLSSSTQGVKSVVVTLLETLKARQHGALPRMIRGHSFNQCCPY